MEHYTNIINYLNGLATAEEKLILKTWLNESAENKRIFDEVADIWQATSVKNNNEYDEFSSFRKVKQTIESKTPVTQTIQFYRLVTRVAAVLILGLIAYVTYQWKTNSTQSISANVTEITAPIGSKSKITLPDGTKVWLNAGSTIRYKADFNISNREITMDGEAYFDVVKNKKIPFRVITSDVSIKVLGTAFNVKAYSKDGYIETTLERGSLIVEQTTPNGEQKITQLEPQQRAIYVKESERENISQHPEKIIDKRIDKKNIDVNGNIVVIKENSTEVFTAWKDNRLVFKNETFETLAIKLERWYGVKITIVDEEIKNYHFNGIIQNETINDVLDIVQLTLPIKYNVLHNNITITKMK